MNGGPVLRFAGVGRDFRAGDQVVPALVDVTLAVAAGELVAVMGQSGSGKSTLLAIGGGLDAPTAGQVWVDGTELRGLPPAALARLRRDRIGYVFQDFNLVSGLTAAETWPCRGSSLARRPGRLAARRSPHWPK